MTKSTAWFYRVGPHTVSGRVTVEAVQACGIDWCRESSSEPFIPLSTKKMGNLPFHRTTKRTWHLPRHGPCRHTWTHQSYWGTAGSAFPTWTACSPPRRTHKNTEATGMKPSQDSRQQLSQGLPPVPSQKSLSPRGPICSACSGRPVQWREERQLKVFPLGIKTAAKEWKKTLSFYYSTYFFSYKPLCLKGHTLRLMASWRMHLLSGLYLWSLSVTKWRGWYGRYSYNLKLWPHE